MTIRHQKKWESLGKCPQYIFLWKLIAEYWPITHTFREVNLSPISYVWSFSTLTPEPASECPISYRSSYFGIGWANFRRIWGHWHAKATVNSNLIFAFRSVSSSKCVRMCARINLWNIDNMLIKKRLTEGVEEKEINGSHTIAHIQPNRCSTFFLSF